MILASQGTQVTETALAESVSIGEAGLDPDVLAELGHRYGLRAEARQLSLEAIVALVGSGRYPIVLLDRSVLDREFAIHAVIPIRFSRHFVTVLDPLRGQRRISVRKFDNAVKRVGGWGVVWLASTHGSS